MTWNLFDLIYAYYSHIKIEKIKSDYRFTVKYSLSIDIEISTNIFN